MTDFKHFKVLHRQSNRIVSIFQFTKDATWKGKEREELIAIPADTPKEVKEIEMCFTHGFKRYEGTEKEQDITAFFKRKSGQPETLSEKRVGGESEAHKLAKNEIYEKLYNKELTINGKNIYELGTKDLTISEEEHSDTGHSIADVLVKFDSYPNHNLLYGLGINIEIQFSNQNRGKTSERTLSRLRDGWSVMWLWKEDFNDDGKLLLKDLNILPREKHLKELKEKEYDNYLEEINELGNILDNKIFEYKDEIKNNINDFKSEIESHLNKKKEELNNVLSEEIEKRLSKQIDFEKIISLVKENINEKEIIKEIVNRHLKEGYTNVKCPFCKSFDCVAYPDIIQCFNCKKRWKNEETIN